MRIGNEKYGTGFVLSGGGAKGFAHLGAIQALKEHGIVPDIISGTSIGALAGAFIGDGYEPLEIMELFRNKKFMHFTEFTMPVTGISKTTQLEQFLKKHLRARRFEELNIPLVVTVSNFDSGTYMHFSNGSLIEPVIASCSIPFVFTPTVINGVHYVDVVFNRGTIM
jgi:NTE family protein